MSSTFFSRESPKILHACHEKDGEKLAQCGNSIQFASLERVRGHNKCCYTTSHPYNGPMFLLQKSQWIFLKSHDQVQTKCLQPSFVLFQGEISSLVRLMGSARNSVTKVELKVTVYLTEVLPSVVISWNYDCMFSILFLDYERLKHHPTGVEKFKNIL